MKTKDIALMGMCIALLAICSFISVPTTVPFTLQTFGVFVVLLLLGGKNGTIAIPGYIILGAIGVPVFAGFSGGFSVILGMTGGYILGFLLTGIAYMLATKYLGEGLVVRIGALIVGLALCYTFGTIWFIKVYAMQVGSIGTMAALSMCVFPFLIPDAIKLIAAVIVAQRVKKATLAYNN